jgi:hypothetical protein
MKTGARVLALLWKERLMNAHTQNSSAQAGAALPAGAAPALTGMMASVAPLYGEKVEDSEWRARVDCAALYRLIALYGWDDMIFTHISLRLPGPDHHFLINPYGFMLLSRHPISSTRLALPSIQRSTLPVKTRCA